MKPRSNPFVRTATALAAFSLAFGAITAHAATVTWNGASGEDWDTGTNWSTSAKPANADIAVFNLTGITSVTNATANQTVTGINFDTAIASTGAFTLGTTGGNKLTLQSGGSTQILSTLTGTGKTITVNAPLVLAGTSYTFANHSPAANNNTLNFGGPITSTSGTTVLAIGGPNTGNNTISGIISNGPSGTMGVTNNGNGTWVLSGANTYTGDTAITAGTLIGIGANAFGSTSVIRIAAGKTLSLRGDATTAFQRADTSALYTLSNNNTGSFINVDAATGDTTAKTMSAGALNTTYTAASYQVNFTGANNTSLSLGAMTGTATTVAGTVIINNNIVGTGTSLTLASYTSANTAAGETVIFTGNGNTFVTGAITPSATTLTLNKGGPGTLTLSSASSYTGATNINVGSLNIQNVGALGATSTGTKVANAATLQLQGGFSYAAEPLTLTPGVAGSGMLLNVSGDNTWNGPITSDTVTDTHTSRIGSDAGTLTLAGLVTLSGSAHQLVLQGEGAITVSGQITGVGRLTSGFGAGIRIVSNNTNNYTGETAINAGTLAGIGANAFGSTSVIRIAALNTLSLRGDATTAFQRADTNAPYTLSTNNNFATINVDAATGDTTAKTMSAGALNTTYTAASYDVNFTGANNTSLSLGAMTGTASTAAGTVIINNNIASTGTLTLASYTSANTAAGETVIFTGSGNTLVTGAINPSATTLSLNKGIGAGTLTLSGTNTYTGPTAINGGTLTLASTGSIATSSSVAVGAAGSFDTSAKTTYTIPAIQPLAFGINATDSGSSGKIVAAGLDISSAVVTYNITGTPDDPVYVLATYTSLTGTPSFASVAAPPTGYTLNYAYEGNKIALVQSPGYASWANDPLKGNIPGEPATGDFDNDGITNIEEYALGQNPRVSSQPAGVLSGNVITYTKGPDAIANGDVSWVIETSQTLAADSWTAVVTQPAADPALIITYTFTLGTPPTEFARLKVTSP
jgi:autotransporter-associated beta strand protein